jgi:hypothetical protein
MVGGGAKSSSAQRKHAQAVLKRARVARAAVQAPLLDIRVSQETSGAVLRPGMYALGHGSNQGPILCPTKWALAFLLVFVLGTAWLAHAWCFSSLLRSVDGVMTQAGYAARTVKKRRHQKFHVNPGDADSVDLLGAVHFDPEHTPGFGADAEHQYHALVLLHVPKTGGGSLTQSISLAGVGDVRERQAKMDELMSDLGMLAGMEGGEDARKAAEHVDAFTGQMYVRHNYPRNSVYDDRSQVFAMDRNGSKGCPLHLSWAEFYATENHEAVQRCRGERELYRDKDGLLYSGNFFALSWHYTATEPYLLQLQERARGLGVSRTFGYPLAVMGHIPYGMHELIPGHPNTAYLVVWRDPFQRSMSHIKYAMSKKKRVIFSKRFGYGAFRVEKWRSKKEKKEGTLRQQHKELFARLDHLSAQSEAQQGASTTNETLLAALEQVKEELKKESDRYDASSLYRTTTHNGDPVKYYDELASDLLDRELLCNWQTSFVGGDVSKMRHIEFNDVWTNVGLDNLCPSANGSHSPAQLDVFDAAMERVSGPHMHHLLLDQYPQSMCVVRRALRLPLEILHKNPQLSLYPDLGPAFEERVRAINVLDDKLYTRVKGRFNEEILPQHKICRNADGEHERQQAETRVKQELMEKQAASNAATLEEERKGAAATTAEAAHSIPRFSGPSGRRNYTKPPAAIQRVLKKKKGVLDLAGPTPRVPTPREVEQIETVRRQSEAGYP